jgi:hypothetical protein
LAFTALVSEGISSLTVRFGRFGGFVVGVVHLLRPFRFMMLQGFLAASDEALTGRRTLQ